MLVPFFYFLLFLFCVNAFCNRICIYQFIGNPNQFGVCVWINYVAYKILNYTFATLLLSFLAQITTKSAIFVCYKTIRSTLSFVMRLYFFAFTISIFGGYLNNLHIYNWMCAIHFWVTHFSIGMYFFSLRFGCPLFLLSLEFQCAWWKAQYGYWSMKLSAICLKKIDADMMV